MSAEASGFEPTSDALRVLLRQAQDAEPGEVRDAVSKLMTARQLRTDWHRQIDKQLRLRIDSFLRDQTGATSRNISIFCAVVLGATLDSQGSEHGVTKERVRQIVARMYRKVREANPLIEDLPHAWLMSDLRSRSGELVPLARRLVKVKPPPRMPSEPYRAQCAQTDRADR